MTVIELELPGFSVQLLKSALGIGWIRLITSTSDFALFCEQGKLLTFSSLINQNLDMLNCVSSLTSSLSAAAECTKQSIHCHRIAALIDPKTEDSVSYLWKRWAPGWATQRGIHSVSLPPLLLLLLAAKPKRKCFSLLASAHLRSQPQVEGSAPSWRHGGKWQMIDPSCVFLPPQAGRRFLNMQCSSLKS